ncbi:Ig-like domain-containing protein [Shewanella sp. TC10]|uniref:Ig-like domain-containing protein n=1 Tax=Shewanella sp. TC10 TaxID=1419739 RepID=UPI00129D6A50|nr:Ig-like domain-containing protein [Shewanella sp. TC10]
MLSAVFLISSLSACGGSDDDAPINNPPVANPVDASTTLDNDILIDALANDTDPDGDLLSLESAVVTDGSGNASIEDNHILFVPESIGITTIRYRISDGNGGEADSTVTVTVTATELTYVGSDTCISCHDDKASHQESGHNFKLTKIEGDQEPIYPFSSISGAVELLDIDNTLGNPSGWQDISYVIGGYMRSAMFIDQNGYIMAGDKAGVNIVPKGEQAFSAYPYSANHQPDSHGFDYCGRCHTTGWKDYTEGAGDERNLHRQDDMPGMGGTFALTGIQCEACHGAGSSHMSNPSKDNIVKFAEYRSADKYRAEDMGFGQAIKCTECHTTDDGVRRYPDYISPYEQIFGGDSEGARLKSSSGFGPEGRLDGRGGRHAAATLIGTDPDTGDAKGVKRDFACSTCHNPHMSKVNQDHPGHEEAMNSECKDCHNMTFADAPGSDFASAAHEFMAQCTDCHMPSKSHLFRIKLDGAKDDPQHFSADGEYIKPWLRAYDSCSSCHESDYDERAKRIGYIHM